MAQKKNEDNKQIIKEFRQRQSRQYLAIAVTMLLLLFFILIYKRSDIFGVVSKGLIMAMQIAAVIAFVVFSFFNWRCPCCNKYLGKDIYKNMCRKCRARLQ